MTMSKLGTEGSAYEYEVLCTRPVEGTDGTILTKCLESVHVQLRVGPIVLLVSSEAHVLASLRHQPGLHLTVSPFL